MPSLPPLSTLVLLLPLVSPLPSHYQVPSFFFPAECLSTALSLFYFEITETNGSTDWLNLQKEGLSEHPRIPKNAKTARKHQRSIYKLVLTLSSLQFNCFSCSSTNHIADNSSVCDCVFSSFVCIKREGRSVE